MLNFKSIFNICSKSRLKSYLLILALAFTNHARSTQILEDKYDYIIVGAGSAGSALTGTLLDQLENEKSIKILLLEAGENNEAPEIRDLMKSSMLTQTRYDWNDITAPQRNLNFRSIVYHSGKVSGGGGSINGMLWGRGHAEDYDEWKTVSGSDDWNSENVAQIFRKIEDHKGSNVDQEPMITEEIPELLVEEKSLQEKPERKYVPLTEIQYPLGSDFMSVAEKMGYVKINNYVDDLQEGVAYPCFNAEKLSNNEIRYERKDAYTCFVKSKVDNQRLTVFNNARVSKLLWADNNTKVNGVEFLHHEDHTTYTFKTAMTKEEGEVILSAGALRTPQILMLSGIGNPEYLNKFKITVLHPLVHVGKNLQDHISTAIVRKLNDKKLKQIRSLSKKEDHEKQKESSGIRQEFNKENNIKMLEEEAPRDKQQDVPTQDLGRTIPHITIAPRHINTTVLTLFFNPHDATKEARQQSLNNNVKQRPSFQIQSYFIPGHKEYLDNYIGFAVIQLRPRSTGVIELLSPSFLDAPKIDLQYFTDARDFKDQVRALKEARKLANAFADDYSNWVEEEIYPGENVISASDLNSYIREWTYPYMHPAGTCRMGKDENDSVVNSELKVHGIKGLRIADNSIMPTIVSVNTNGTAMMIGVKCAEFIARAYQSKIENAPSTAEHKS